MIALPSPRVPFARLVIGAVLPYLPYPDWNMLCMKTYTAHGSLSALVHWTMRKGSLF